MGGCLSSSSGEAAEPRPPSEGEPWPHELEELRLALIGFGSANRALARMLLDKSEPRPDDDDSPWRRHLRVPIGSSGDTRLVPWRVVCIVTRRHGRACAVHPIVAGGFFDYQIDLPRALELVEEGKQLDHTVFLDRKTQASFDGSHKAPFEQNVIVDNRTDAHETIDLIERMGRTKSANVVVEAIPSDPKGDGQPALSFIGAALQHMHVVSANKSPLAHRDEDSGEETYWQLQRLAERNGFFYRHESAVMDGVPIFSLWGRTLQGAELRSVRGCLNSTTTAILTRMEGNLDESTINGELFEEALDAAKRSGIVEEDEGLDVDGYDAAVKLRALLVAFTPADSKVKIPTMDEIPRDSIRGVTREEIRYNYAHGRRKLRLVASARLLTKRAGSRGTVGDQKWEARVELERLPPSDPLYRMTGTDASVKFGTDVLGPLTVVSSGPTLTDTAYGLFSDIVRVASESKEL